MIEIVINAADKGYFYVCGVSYRRHGDELVLDDTVTRMVLREGIGLAAALVRAELSPKRAGN